MVISGKFIWHIWQRQAASPLSVFDKAVWVLSAHWLLTVSIDIVGQKNSKNPIFHINQGTLMIDCLSYHEFVFFVVPFQQLPAVSILWSRLPCGQYDRNPTAAQSSWHVKILSYVDAFAIGRRSRSALPPLLLKGLSFSYKKLSDSFHNPWTLQGWSLWTFPSQFPEMIASRKSGISHIRSSRSSDLEAPQTVGRGAPPGPHGPWLRGGRTS